MNSLHPVRTRLRSPVRPDIARRGCIAALALVASACGAAPGLRLPGPEEKRMSYPTSRRGDTVESLHGREIVDPYRWLEDLDSPETRAWIEAQNQLTFAWLQRAPHRDRIRARLEQLWDYEKWGVPFRVGGRYFVHHNDGLQNQSVLLWMEDPADEPGVLLDPNELSDDGTVALASLSVSEDGRLLAYGLSTAGSDWQEWRVREVDTGRDLDDRLRWIKFSGAAWSHDHAGFYYSRYDEPVDGEELRAANYNQKLYYHRLGTPQSEDVMVYARPDHPDWGFGASVTDDGRYLVIGVWRGTQRENGLFYVDLEQAPDPPTQREAVVELLNEFDADYGFVGNDGPVFYLRTDLDAPMGRLIAIDTRDPARGNRRTIVPEGAEPLRSVGFVGGRFIASTMRDAHSRVVVHERDGTEVGEIELPGLGTAAGFGGRADDPETFYVFTGFTDPGTVYRYDVATGRSTAWRTPRVDFDPARYESRQVFCRSRDGTRIPFFIVHRRAIEPDGSPAAYLYGYGGFNAAVTPAFSVSHLVWMEMGGVYVQACLRGGGEYGREWHEAGMKANKQNVFDDFVAVAEWLVDNGYTRPDRLAIGGGSNGGLLVGACMAQRPDLFAAAVPAVGVFDMLRFHRFTIGWAWTSDYGSPDDPDEFEVLRAYSPLHNLRDGVEYPATLITTGDHDDRVFPAHSFKFAAALQAANGGDAPVLIRIETRAGHGAGKPTSKAIDEIADRWAFVAGILGVDAGHDLRSVAAPGGNGDP